MTVLPPPHHETHLRLGLEELFGDPQDDSSPFSYREILAADSDRRLVESAEAILQDWGFSSEFVPRRLGGRWVSTEDLVRRLSPIFRRDPSLGLGHGVTTLMAASNVWVGADAIAKRKFADRLLLGHRVAVAFHEMSHGNDLLGNEFTAERLGGPEGGWKLNGHKEIINNIDRAPSVLLFVKTQQHADARAFSLLLWNKDEAISGVTDTSLRVATTGVRGCQIGIASLQDLVLPDSAIVGSDGDGVPVALRAFQVTRSVIPALVAATLSAAVGLSVPFALERRLYDATVWDLPHTRMLITKAWSGLLVAEALARTSVRCLHVRPDESFLLSAATKFLVPELINSSMEQLATLFGSSFYTISAPYGAIEKWLRDLVIVPIGHAGSRTCLQSLVPNLPSWARRSRRDGGFTAELFSTSARLPEITFDGLGIGAGHRDSVSSVLHDQAVISALTHERPDLVRLVTVWALELDELRAAVRQLDPGQLGPDAPPDVLALARRQACVFAAGALVGTWFENRNNDSSAFHNSEVALEAGLIRLFELLTPTQGHTSKSISDEQERPTDRAEWPQGVIDAAASHIRQTQEAGWSLGIEELEIAHSSPGSEKSRNHD